MKEIDTTKARQARRWGWRVLTILLVSVTLAIVAGVLLYYFFYPPPQQFEFGSREREASQDGLSVQRFHR